MHQQAVASPPEGLKSSPAAHAADIFLFLFLILFAALISGGQLITSNHMKTSRHLTETPGARERTSDIGDDKPETLARGASNFQTHHMFRPMVERCYSVLPHAHPPSKSAANIQACIR